MMVTTTNNVLLSPSRNITLPISLPAAITIVTVLSKGRDSVNHWINCKVLGFLRNTRGAVAFEYVLILGAVSVAGLAAMVAAPNLMTVFVSAVCEAMDSVVLPLGTLSC